MSKKDDFQNNETQEPWEQPIYDTEGDGLGSRSQQRRSKNGNKVFLISLVVMLAVCILMLSIFYALLSHDDKRAAVPESTTTETTAITSTTESSSSESSSTAESSSTETSSTSESSEAEAADNGDDDTTDNQAGADQGNQNQDNNETANGDGTTTNADGSTTNADGSTTNANGTDQGQTSGDTTTVLAGEGPNQVAARVGISVETLYQLNGIDPNNFLLVPGQELRIR